MKSGLGDRNNKLRFRGAGSTDTSLNEVRSWRPEQCVAVDSSAEGEKLRSQ